MPDKRLDDIEMTREIGPGGTPGSAEGEDYDEDTDKPATTQAGSAQEDTSKSNERPAPRKQTSDED